MIGTVGVAVEGRHIRCAYRQRGETVVVEQPWDGTSPDAAINRLQAQVGAARALSLSVGLAFLEVAKPGLPPLAPEGLRRVLLRDAARYFPLDGRLAVAASAHGAVAFAMPADTLEHWVRALQTWAPVRAIVAAPTAIATLMAADGTASGTFGIEAAEGEHGLLHMENGELRRVRRAPSVGVELPAGTRLLDQQSFDGAAGQYAAALGALALVQMPVERMLLDVQLEVSLRGWRTRRQWVSAALLAFALVAVGIATNARRDRTLRFTQHAVDSLSALAAPVVALQAQANQLNEEAQLLGARNAIANPLAAIAALSRTLPGDAFVERLEWNGRQWRLDGSVNQAAAVVPSLDSARMFSDVRVLGASTRFRDGARMRETFSVGFAMKAGTNATR